MNLRKKAIMVMLAASMMGISSPVFAAKNSQKSNDKVVKVTKKTKVKEIAESDVQLDEDNEDQLFNTIVKRSKVTLNHKAHFYDSNGKKQKKTAKKNKSYTIYQIRTIDADTYYKTKNNLWLKSSDVRGSVQYQENEYSVMTLKTNKKGKLSYTITLPDPSIKDLVVKHNSYVYDNNGLLQLGKNSTVTLLKKGKKLKGYGVRKVHGKKFYITNYGWIKYKNLAKVKTSKKK